MCLLLSGSLPIDVYTRTCIRTHIHTHMQDMSGYSSGPKFDKLGMRGSNTSQLFFDDVRVPGKLVFSSNLHRATVYKASILVYY